MSARAETSALFFDGQTNKRHSVELQFGSELSICEGGVTLATWQFKDIRRADAAPGRQRFACTAGPPLARLDVAQASQDALEILARSKHAGTAYAGDSGTFRIVFWSLAAVASICLLVVFGIPYAADLVAPIVPPFFEKRIGEMADRQISAVFGQRICTDVEGTAAFRKLVRTMVTAGGLDLPVEAEILSVNVPNAIALPGGKVYLFSALLRKANNADEIAGVIGHELGHVRHHDGTRLLIANGGSSFLLGLLFGDIGGASAAVFATRTLISAAYSREMETRADTFAIEAMHALHRSPKPMGQLLFRVTGAQQSTMPTILASHPLTEERLARMSEEAKPDDGPSILTDAEWQALKRCGS